MLEKAALLLGQARGAYQREQYEIALAYFRRARDADPHSPEALLGIGEVAAFLQLVGEAIDAFLTLADVYTKAGMLEVATEVVDRVLELDPQQPIARRFHAFIRQRLRRPTGHEGRASTDSIVTSLELQAPVKHKHLADVQSESSLSDFEPWAESDDSLVSQATTGVSARSLDDVFGELEEPTEAEEITAAKQEATRKPVKVEGPSVGLRRLAKTETDDPDGPTEVDPFKEPTVESPAKRLEKSARRIGFADTVISSAEPPPEARRPLAAKPPSGSIIDEDSFGDVSTQIAPAGLMEDLAIAARDESDPFSADTINREPPKRRGQTLSGWAEATKVDQPTPSAHGSGKHPVADWEHDTTAAIAAENFRIKPQMSLEALELDENDFPAFEEGQLDADMITRTIALEGEGAMEAIIALMGVSPLLAQLDIGTCQELIQSCEVTQCFAGQIIFEEGQRGASLFLLITGQAAVERTVEGQAARRVATISPGNFFGEGSLLADAPRSSTVQIIEDALVLELDRQTVQRLVAKKPRVLTVLTRFLRARLLSTLMMDSPLFHRIPLDERTDLAPRIHLHKLNPGQDVAQRGQVLTGFCTLMAGELKRFDLAEGTGSLAKLGPGSSFGSQSLAGEPSPVSISAETGCWLLRLPTEDLRELVERHPELIDALQLAESV